jgi:hypothetical protein
MSFESIKMGRISKQKKKEFILKNMNKEEEEDNEMPTDENKEETYQLLNETLLPVPKSSRNRIKFRLDDILPSTMNAKLCLTNQMLGSHLFAASLLRDTARQTYTNYLAYLKPDEEKALVLASQNGRATQPGSDATLREVWFCLMNEIATSCHRFFNLLSSMPGFSELCPQDITKLIKENFVCIKVLETIKFYINDELYHHLSGSIQFSKKWMLSTIGPEVTAYIYDFVRTVKNMGLTESELSLIIPFILLQTGKAHLIYNFEICVITEYIFFLNYFLKPVNLEMLTL